MSSCAHILVNQVLIDGGCEVDGQSDDGETPLHNAAYLGFTDATKILLKVT